jgi:hypothetical protein
MHGSCLASADGDFRPHPWLVGGHRQTLLGHLLRRRLRWRLPSEAHEVESAGGVRLLVRASWQPGRRRTRPALLIVHGLGGNDGSSYVVSTGHLAFVRGFHVLRMNMRGSGDGERLSPLLYNAGLDGDLIAVLEWLARRVPRIVVAGFSLGASLALLAAGRCREVLPDALAAVAAVSPPLDLAECASALERRENRLYHAYFMKTLVAAYRRRRALHPDLFPAVPEQAMRTLRAYDHHVTAPLGGYDGATDYYARSSAGPWLASIDRPALVVAAADDPMVPVESATRWPVSPSVQREITPSGGHVGYVSQAEAPGFFWAPGRVLRFLDAVA